MILNIQLETINRLLGIGNSEVVGNIIIETDIITNKSENEVEIDIGARKVTAKLGPSYYDDGPEVIEYYRGYNVYCKKCLKRLTAVITTDHLLIIKHLHKTIGKHCPHCNTIFTERN